VFLYHQAAAMPPSTAEAAATNPTFIQRDDDGRAVCGGDDVADSKEVFMSDNSFRAHPAIFTGLSDARLLDAGSPKTVKKIPSQKNLDFCIAFFSIYVIVDLFQ
jgi:hypothetical protein